MANCDIKAHIRMEERYEGLQLVFGLKSELKQVILDAIDEVSKETGLTPNTVMENVNHTKPEKSALYIEFNDDYDREGGPYFESVLQKLSIDCCEE